MREITDLVQLIVSVPFFTVTAVAFALVTAARWTVLCLRPTCEKEEWFKVVLLWANFACGIGLACLAKGVGEFNAPWGYLIILGMLSGSLSIAAWHIAKPLLKIALKRIAERSASVVPASPAEKPPAALVEPPPAS